MNKLTKAHASPKDDNTHTRSVAAIPKDHPPSGKDNNNNALEARQVSTQESKKLPQTFSRRTHAGNWHELCRPQKARDTIAQQQTEALPLNTDRSLGAVAFFRRRPAKKPSTLAWCH